MFRDSQLQEHLETSSTIKLKSLVVAEWNMNNYDNISLIGNYRYRPTDSASKYYQIQTVFDTNDTGYFYTNATDSDVTIDGGLTDSNTPTVFLAKAEKEKMLYSLEDCFGKFRPRSGINKLRYFSDRFTHFSNPEMSRRPRYYLSTKDDQFKYWTSYRTESDNELTEPIEANRKTNIEHGIANIALNNKNYINDAAPFVVYKNAVPTNRVIVKMQTHIGDINLGPFSDGISSTSDPFFGYENAMVPQRWKIQGLKGNSWIDLIRFDENSEKSDGSPVIGPDGYVEIAYSPSGWFLIDNYEQVKSNLVTDMTNPSFTISPLDQSSIYNEFEYLSGLRIVVDTMTKFGSTLDLIELSPRLLADISDKVLSFDITKQASDLGASSLPVGQLLSSTGGMELFDYDNAFNSLNTDSILYGYSLQNTKINFYEEILEVGEFDYLVPIKTMYVDGFPEFTEQRGVSITLRDQFLQFESILAPELLIQNASLSYAISLILDSIGFSNYVIKRIPGEDEIIIPYFFVAPETTVADVLNNLAISAQAAMFFDEYNNFVVMNKNYIIPNEEDRITDITLYGSVDMEDDGIVENKTTSPKLSNIIDIASQNSTIFNDGRINYDVRYIQRSYGSLKQALMLENDKTWIYKPSLLWEASGTETLRPINDDVSNMSNFALSAMPLNSSLSEEVPYVRNSQIYNNVIDFGESIYWLGRYNGYFYANGEIIRYDAVEYNIPGSERQVLAQDQNGQYIYDDNGQIRVSSKTIGSVGNVWISSAQEYQKYFANLSFNGKIYPTGKIRIYTEPEYYTDASTGVSKMVEGPIKKHGRGQFNTTITSHSAGITQNSYWVDDANVRGCLMDSKYLFDENQTVPSTAIGAAGIKNDVAKKTTRNGIVKNFLSSVQISEDVANTLSTAKAGTVQASALIMNGPTFTSSEKPIDFISYVYKPLTQAFKHFGTRMRIVGKLENSLSRIQTPIGSTTYYNVSEGSATASTTQTSGPSNNITVGGASGGLAISINPETNNGYYFEIAALTEDNISSYSGIRNIFFYKIKKSASGDTAIPVPLWSGWSSIIASDGKFIDIARLSSQENSTLYDLSVEYKDENNKRIFYLYINNRQVATVIDEDPLPIYNNMALFIRGSARVMFENIYAITNNYSQNTGYNLATPVETVFGDNEISMSEVFRKYAISGMVQSTYLSGISPQQPPKYNIYFEEFGTIMREVAYFNIKYDKAYPALRAKIAPTFNNIQGYTVSGFTAGAYGAEFLVFNAADKALSLDETSGNYLRILGVTFTQQSQSELTVDNYFAEHSASIADIYSDIESLSSPQKVKQKYLEIKNNRATFGKKDFTLAAPYIQKDEDANSLMAWLISKVMKPRKSVGVNIFAMPIIQLGDIVKINYKSENVNEVSLDDTRFVVYHIEYSRDLEGPNMTIYLSEVG